MTTLIGVNTRGYRVGESHHRAKLREIDVDLIRELHDTGCIGYKRISRVVSCSWHTVRDIVLCRRRYQTAARFVRR